MCSLPRFRLDARTQRNAIREGKVFWKPLGPKTSTPKLALCISGSISGLHVTIRMRRLSLQTYANAMGLPGASETRGEGLELVMCIR